MNRFLIVLFIFTGMAYAQHNDRTSRNLQFRFGNPGARSLGFGGAFIGLADDATAPVANPAGMVLTDKRSASFEFNYSQQNNPIPFQSGNILQTNLFEFEYHLNESSAPVNEFQVPYLAVVFPKGKFRYAFFAHQQANVQRNYETDRITVCDFSNSFHPECDSDIEDPQTFPSSRDAVDMVMMNAGFSLAWQFGERFSMGLSGFFSDLDYNTRSEVTIVQNINSSDVTRMATGKDSSWGAIFGSLLKVTEDLSFGFTYKYQPEFTYLAELVATNPVPHFRNNFKERAKFKIPDSLGFGVSLQPLDQLVINADFNRIFYSQITDDLLSFTPTNDDNPIFQTMADITEIHLGVEWIILSFANPVSLRFGYWLEPYHAMVNNIEDNQILEGPVDRPYVRDTFFLHRFEEDENHYSFGVGLTFGARFQFDMAVEIADQSETAIASGIYRF